MVRRFTTFLLVMTAQTLLATIAHGQTGTPVLMAVDPRFGVPHNLQLGYTPSIGLIGDAILARQNKQESEIASKFREAVQLDDLGLLKGLSIPIVDGEVVGGEIVLLENFSVEAIRSVLAERGFDEALVVRHYVASGNQFFARLVVERVATTSDDLDWSHVATAVYFATLPADLREVNDVWSPQAIPQLQALVHRSLQELGEMWARLAADTTNGRTAQESWENLNPIAKSGTEWVFKCGISKPCKEQKLIRSTESRVWIGAHRGSMIGSLDRDTAAAGSLLLPIW